MAFVSEPRCHLSYFVTATGIRLDFSNADGVEHFHPVLGDDGAAERRHAVCGANRFELVVDRKSQPAVGEARRGRVFTA